VFQQLRGGYSGSHPDSIRRMMTQATVAATDPRARLVGEDTYVAAGGRIERDLFCDESEARWLDIALLERLAGDKMEALAAQAAAETGLAWVRPTLDSWVGSSLTAGLHRILPDTAPLTEEESARIEAAQAEIEALIADLEDEQTEDEAREQAESRVQALEQEIERITDKPPLLNEAQKAQLGTFLLLSHDGRAKLDSSFYGELPPVEREPEEGREREREPSSPAVIGTGGEPVEKPQPLSRALIDELAIQRRDILAVHVAADPGLALDLAIFLMIDREAGYSSEKSGSSLLALAPTDPVFGFKTPDAAATVARAQAAEALDRSWVSATSRAERFDAFRALPQEVRAAWLGQAVARTLEASLNLPGERRCPFHDHLGRLLGVEVARWWRPTGSNYFDRVAKSVTLAALEEVGGPPFAARYAKAKKAELSETAQRVFAGEFIGEVEVKERALSWVPEPMRFASAPAAEPIDDLPPWEEEEAFEPPNAGNQQAAAPGANEDGNEAVAAPADPFEDECESPPAIVSDDREEGEAEAGGTAPFEQIEEAA
jgi:ParB family chromosome partitioning protein